MNKKYFLKELKDYCSIFISFIFLLIIFSNNMTFATTCAEIEPRKTLDHCDTYEVDYKDTTSSVDRDGNRPAQCKSINLEYNPYKSPDYYYDSRNKDCLIWSITISITYALASIAASAVCNKFTPIVGVDPAEMADDARRAAEVSKKVYHAKSVLQILKATKGALVKAGGGVAFSVLTDPIIALQIELGLDVAVLSGLAIYNGIQCSTWSASAAIPPVNPVAVANASAACTMTALCAGAAVSLAALLQTLIFGSTGVIHGAANDQINRAKLCGYDWEGKVFTEYDVNNFNEKELYPQTGSFSNSYSYKLKKCFEHGSVKALTDYNVRCSDVIDGDGACELGGDQCEGITMQSRTMKNRLYREILYNGKEFKIDKDYGSGKCIDPRPEIQKGFKGVEQRYYFRGTDSGQYVCKRFRYKNQGCVLADGTMISMREATDDDSKASLCRQVFEDAFNCCKSRAALGVCIYDTDSNGRDSDDNTMCLRVLDSEDSPDTCSLNTGHGIVYSPEFMAFTSEVDSTRICIKNTNYCPYAYNVAGGTIVEDLYCNGDYSCENAKPKSEISSSQRFLIPSTEDKARIWSSSKPKFPTNAYGETKNYCTHNAHCTEIGDTGDSEFQDMADNKFLPRVCFDFVGDSQNLPVPAPLFDLNNPVTEHLIAGVDFSLGEYRGFTAPIAQCIKETLNNMFHNKAGQSFCKNKTEEVNSEGLCGNDTFGPPESINPDKYYYIVGQDLPADSNIFYKLQSRLQFIIKMAAIFAIILIGLNFLLKGEFDIFGDPKKPKAMLVEMMKFAIVFYFAVGNAWQSKFYKWIDDASGYLYYKSFDLSLLGYGGYKNVDYEAVCKRTETTSTCGTQTITLQNITFNENTSFVISPNATTVKLEVWGGRGGTNGGPSYGKGGYSFGTIELPSSALSLNAGDTLYVKIGASGESSRNGGGATDIRLSDTAHTCNVGTSDPRIIVAGGAGGNGSGIYDFADRHDIGGNGGGGHNNGNNGTSYDSTAFGHGGTLSAGGAGGAHSSYYGTNGTCGSGGIGNGQSAGGAIYGNGGAGWYGGGGASGGWSGGSGGGGSGYINANLIDRGGDNGVNTGAGYAKITSHRTEEECFHNTETDDNYIVDNFETAFPGGNIPTSPPYCINSGNVKTCYSDCIKREKKDLSGNKIYIWSDTYDGCYFGDAYYPEGKQYLAIFDSLDCKLMNYFKYTPGTNLPGILHMLLLSILWSPLALVVVCLGFLFFIILLSIVIKIFHIFLMSIIAVNLLIYISPLVFPALLFKRYKNMFTIWLDSLMGYILQVVFVVVFAGLVIGNLEKLGLGDAKYINHHEATGRLPFLDCSSSDISLLCIFNVDTSKGEQPAFGTKIYKFLGLGPLVAIGKSINNNFVGTVITLIKACLILYVLLQFLKKIPLFALDLAGAKALLNFDNSKLEPGNMMKGLMDKTEIGMKAAKYGGRKLGGGLKDGGSKLIKDAKEFGGAVSEARKSVKEAGVGNTFKAMRNAMKKSKH